MFAACAAAGTQEMLEAADSSHMHMEGLSLSCSHCCVLLKENLLYVCVWLETVAGKVTNFPIFAPA